MHLAGGLVDFEALTGQSKFVIDLLTIPFFSAFAGYITNWTGVLMLFAPLRFSGLRLPGVHTFFHLMPRRVQILPCWAPGGVIGFQGFIPSRAEKMASLSVDLGLGRVGTLTEFFDELDPDGLAEYFSRLARPQLRPMLDEVMRAENPQLWQVLPDAAKDVIVARLVQRLPTISHRLVTEISTNIDQLVNLKLMVIGFLRRNPEILKDIIYELGTKELKFMVRIGPTLGFPLGIVLALLLHVWPSLPLVGSIPTWAVVIGGAATVGVIVNIIAIKVVFEPGAPAPRWRYIWKQASFAKRQHEAAASFGASIAHRIITLPNLADALMNGPKSDNTRKLLRDAMRPEIDNIIGPARSAVRLALGAKQFDRIRDRSAEKVVDFMPQLMADEAYAHEQALRVEEFATARLRALPPEEFVELLYSAVEQDAWLLYAHGGVLGLVVGLVHLVIFGA